MVMGALLALILALSCVETLLLPSAPLPTARRPPPALWMSASGELEAIQAQRLAAEEHLAAAAAALEEATSAHLAAQSLISERTIQMREKHAAVAQALRAQKQAERAKAAAVQASKDKLAVTRTAQEVVVLARTAVKEARSAEISWGKLHPVEAASKVGAEVAGVAGTALLTVLFGESKAEREVREAREAELASAEIEMRAQEEMKRQQAKHSAIERLAADRKLCEEAKSHIRISPTCHTACFPHMALEPVSCFS